MRPTRRIERSMGDWARGRLPFWLQEFIMFGLKMGWAALFGGALLAGIILTKVIWQPYWAIARYDMLMIYAVALQIAFLLFKLETWEEAKVIALFHLTGTAMELFKVDAGSWAYPEAGLIKILDVPLFSGFMYAAVGSFMARTIRIFRMTFAPYPPLWMTFVLAGAIYINFFAHHFGPDIRIILFIGTVVLFWRTRIWFYIGKIPRWMPLPLAAFLSSFFLWVAENIGTSTGTWVYAGSASFEMASLSKMGSWYLLLYVSFVTVTLVTRQALSLRALTPLVRTD